MSVDSEALSLEGFTPFWTRPQVTLAEVFRWGKYTGANPYLRPQNNLGHTHGFSQFMVAALEILKPYIPTLDSELIKDGVLEHDVGEGETGTDTLYIDKNLAGDVREYILYAKLISVLPLVVQARLKRAFLLQFCLKPGISVFPPDAQEILLDLAATKRIEALIFDAGERFDYVLYAYECWKHANDQVILTQVLRNQAHKLDRLTLEIPGFYRIWTPETSGWAEKFIQDHIDVLDERTKPKVA